MLEELERFEPEIAAATGAAASASRRRISASSFSTASFFGKAPKTSIDYAVMERTDRAVVLAADVGWSRCRRMVDGLAAEPAGRQRQQPARRAMDDQLVERARPLRRAPRCGHRPQQRHRRRHWGRGARRRPVADGQGEAARRAAQGRGTSGGDPASAKYRPWGYYQSVDQGERYQVKRIVVRPGGRLSLQEHYHRAEHWIVVRRAAEVTLDGKGTISCTRTSRSICRSARRTGSPIRARSLSS